MTFRQYSRAEWGAKPPQGPYMKITGAVVEATVHHSASKMTPAGPTTSPPEKPRKPGPKWYAIWRSKTAAAMKRRAASRAITKYNKALVAWRAGAVHEVPASLIELEKSIMRSFQAFHMGPDRGWNDIGYHLVIFATGNRYEGRPKDVYGAHAYGANRTRGICFVEDTEPLTINMIDSFHEYVDQEGLIRFVAHRDQPGNSTTCPGDAVVRALGLKEGTNG